MFISLCVILKPMERKITLQKIRKEFGGDVLKLAEAYYTLVSVINGIHLTQREAQILAFTAVRGSISYAHVKDEFCKMYNTSGYAINNHVSRLKKTNMLIRERGKIIVHPSLSLKFNENDVVLQILLKNGQA